MHVHTQHTVLGKLSSGGFETESEFAKWQRYLWCLLFAASGLVFFEPAPFDLISLFSFVLFLVLGLRIPNQIYFFIICIGLFICFSFLSSMNAFMITDATRHILITTFLALMSLFTACVLACGDRKMMEFMWRGWMIAAIIATLAGIAGFMELVPGAEQFTRYGRAQGTFKDPNVFGPFLVPPIIYAFMKYVQSKGIMRLLYIALMSLLAIGILLSFSRAAWGHLIISLLIAMVAIMMTTDRKGERFGVVLFIALSTIICTIGLSVLLNLDGFRELFAERFSLNQTYDSGGQGRFDGQAKAINFILDHPWGIGANEFLRYWPEAPHNVYLTNFLSGGWIAGLSYIALVIVTLVIGLKDAFSQSPYRSHMIIAASSFACLAMVGFVVDTDHWRHFFILLGAVWGLHIAIERSKYS